MNIDTGKAELDCTRCGANKVAPDKSLDHGWAIGVLRNEEGNPALWSICPGCLRDLANIISIHDDAWASAASGKG